MNFQQLGISESFDYIPHHISHGTSTARRRSPPQTFNCDESRYIGYDKIKNYTTCCKIWVLNRGLPRLTALSSILKLSRVLPKRSDFGRLRSNTASIRAIPFNDKNVLCFPSRPVIFYTPTFWTLTGPFCKYFILQSAYWKRNFCCSRDKRVSFVWIWNKIALTAWLLVRLCNENNVLLAW